MVKRSCSLLKEKILNRKWSGREISFVKTISPAAALLYSLTRPTEVALKTIEIANCPQFEYPPKHTNAKKYKLVHFGIFQTNKVQSYYQQKLQIFPFIALLWRFHIYSLGGSTNTWKNKKFEIQWVPYLIPFLLP